MDVESLGFRAFARVAVSVLLLAGLSVFGFALLVLLPGDYAEVVLINRMDGELPSATALAAFRAANGFDDPLPLQYAAWLSGFFSGDLGTSFVTGDPVIEEVALRLAATVQLVGAAFLMMLAVALPLGALAALHQGSVLDRLVMALAVLGMSMPNFWQALLLVLLFSLTLGWLPSSGYGTGAHVILPAVVIATSSAGLVARFVRASLIDALAEPHVRTALAKGLSPARATLSHALPTGLPAILTILGLQLARMFDGAIVVETVFAWPGLGRLLVDAILNRDYPVLQAALLVIGTGYILINLLIDLAISAIDPRASEVV